MEVIISYIRVPLLRDPLSHFFGPIVRLKGPIDGICGYEHVELIIQELCNFVQIQIWTL